jgi:hypothetical protein
MSFAATVLEVLVASPGDTTEERTAVSDALIAWNVDRARREQYLVLPRLWETSAVPKLAAGGGQSVINEQLVAAADIVIAFFDTRLGHATPEAVSGTAEEITKAHASGKPVHVWFSDEPLPRDVDQEQLQALDKFKQTLMAEGLLGSYSSALDLGYKVRQAIEHDLEHFEQAGPPPRRGGARLRASYTSEREQKIDNKGKLSYRTVRQQLVVENIGAAPAIDVAVELTPLPGDDGGMPQIHRSNAHPTINPDTSFGWPVLMHAGVTAAARVTMTYTENGEQRTETQDITLR